MKKLNRGDKVWEACSTWEWIDASTTIFAGAELHEATITRVTAISDNDGNVIGYDYGAEYDNCSFHFTEDDFVNDNVYLTYEDGALDVEHWSETHEGNHDVRTKTVKWLKNKLKKEETKKSY